MIARLCIEKIRKRKRRKSTGKIEKIEKNAGVKMPLLSSPLSGHLSIRIFMSGIATGPDVLYS